MRGAVTSTGNGDIVKLPVSHVRTRLGYSIVLSLACAAILAAALLSYRAIDRELTESALSRRAAVAHLAAAVLSEKFARLADIGTSLATRVRFRELVEAGEWTEAIKILSSIPRDFPFIDRLTLNDLSGTLMADVPEAPAVRGQNFAHRDWYQAVMRDGKPYISRVYRRSAAPQTNVFVAAVPVKNGKGEMLGILVMQVRADTFFEWTRGVDVGYSGFIYVVDQRGALAVHPKFPPQGDLVDYSAVPVVQRVLQGKRGVEIAFNPVEKEERVASYQPIEKHGWGVVVEQPAATVFETRDDQLQLVLAAYGLILLFIAIVTYLVSRIASQRRQAVAQQASLAAIVDSSEDAIISTGLDGIIRTWNRGAEHLFGYRADEAVGQPVAILIPPDRQDEEMLIMERILRGERVEHFDSVRRKKDGTPVDVSLTISPVNDTAGQVVGASKIVRDMTERKRFEQTLQQSNRELESFSYSVSHDLRSPLRAIDGFSRIVLEDYADKLDDEGRRLLGVICENSKKMGGLIDDLLEYSRLGRKALSTAAIDMKRLVEEVLRELQVSGEKPPRSVPEALPPARGDATLLKLVWTNLLGNAVKFSSKREQPVIEVSGYENGAENIYCVKDNGAGFDMRYYDKLFGVFQRLHSAEEFDGTGVGLAIVQRVITRHGGRVWAEGKVDDGAAFYFSLPKEKQDGQV